MKKLRIFFAARTWGFMLIHQQERDLSRARIVDLCDLVN